MYKLKTDWEGTVNGVINLENGYVIPFSPDNTDYQEYLKWLAEGNTPLPAEGTE